MVNVPNKTAFNMLTFIFFKTFFPRKTSQDHLLRCKIFAWRVGQPPTEKDIANNREGHSWTRTLVEPGPKPHYKLDLETIHSN
jgi:hypothetical protein